MRGKTPTLHCDGDGGDCGTWDVDLYACDASSTSGLVDGKWVTTKITAAERAPGWICSDEGDYCSAECKAGATP